MALNINTNTSSLNAQRNQARTQVDLSTSLARLSSGLRINSAKDDAAGLAIADRFTAQVRGTTQASRNANDGISLAQTAEGSLSSIAGNLQRMRELAVQAANASNSPSDRASLQLEVAQLQSEVDRVASQTTFNGVNLLDGSFAGQQFQVGANANQTITVPTIPSVRTGALGLYRGLSFSTTGAAANNTPALFGVIVSGIAIDLGTVAIDAKAIAAAINAGNVAGLSATADATQRAGTSAAVATGPGTGTFTLNGVPISLAGTSGAAALGGNRAVAVAAINAQSALTGVVASDIGSGVSLVAADGRNIAMSYAAGSFTGSTVADFGLSASTLVNTKFNVTYVAPANVSGNILFYGSISPGGTIATTGTALGAIDVSTAAGANAALASIDLALSTVDAARASLGAVQNRFASTIETLQSGGENLSASRSRIQDADFAIETANLSRAQVLQQAGTAMIAQANQMPSQVLTLLR